MRDLGLLFGGPTTSNTCLRCPSRPRPCDRRSARPIAAIRGKSMPASGGPGASGTGGSPRSRWTNRTWTGGGALRGTQSAAGPPGRPAPRLSLEQARAHLRGKDDCRVQVSPLLELAGAGNWRRLLATPLEDEQLDEFRSHGRTGRVLGGDRLLTRWKRLVRMLSGRNPAQAGRKSQSSSAYRRVSPSP